MSDALENTQVKQEEDAKEPVNGKRKRAFLGLGGAIALCALGTGVWMVFFAGKTVSTDNAYTAVEVAQITPLVNGPVKQVKVVDTQAVHAGDVLVVLDDTDARIAVAQAEADLDHARRQVQQIMRNDISLSGQMDLHEAQIRSAESDVVRARATFDKASLDEKRRQNLVAGGSVSVQEFTDSQTTLREATATLQQAEASVNVARAALAAAGGARQSNAALFSGSTVDSNPTVRAAAARLQQARVNLDRTVLRAPIDGIVTQRAVDMGQQVQAGTRLMSIVPISQIYVDANFKEVQLSKVRPGQKVRLTSDLYGDDVVYDGQVEGFEGGTGSALSVIPAQNATGNWIKVVQRLPVRIRLDPAQLAKHPLRIGLSMDATVDLASSRAIRSSARG
ncbi:HlyD family efflux transporter periplasmic adaptor subunit [Rhodanobacter sp. 115]|uniref:HlyD family secretion protein n=1 Tax=Rhodanobacter sp. FW021-MT20 TaxID=1162282 RepID=UPI0003052D94|nr:HlyD family efflux transporter periplasmic adaptor subunit [Rhodanobacter sp. 115]